jgi:hypothetical protein
LEIDEVDDATLEEPRIAAKGTIKDISQCSAHDHAECDRTQTSTNRPAFPNQEPYDDKRKESDPSAEASAKAERRPAIERQLETKRPDDIDSSILQRRDCPPL